MEKNELRTTSWTDRYTQYLLRRLAAAEKERDALKERLERLAALRVCGRETSGE